MSLALLTCNCEEYERALESINIKWPVSGFCIAFEIQSVFPLPLHFEHDPKIAGEAAPMKLLSFGILLHIPFPSHLLHSTSPSFNSEYAFIFPALLQLLFQSNLSFHYHRRQNILKLSLY